MILGITKLSSAQSQALAFLSGIDGWTNATPVTQKCLNKLSEMGLITVAYDADMGWCEKITDMGYEVIKQHGFERGSMN